MVFSPSRCLFMSTLILGITISISSNSWFGAWMGLELNLLSFIPLIFMKDNQYSSEAALKYFLIQALGSTVLLISAVMIMMKMQVFSAPLSAALLLKAGSAPFHFWFPPTLEGMMWPQALVLMTIQKITPMSLLSYYIEDQMMLISVAAMMSAVVGALGGLNQTLLRKLLGYSSINHMAWMMSALLMSESMWLLYFAVYSVMSFSVVMLFHFTQTFHFNHLLNHIPPGSAVKMVMFMSLLSLGGLPPFTGFVPKWIVIQQLCWSSNFLMLTILLGSSLFTLFYYLRVTLSSLVLSSAKTKWSIKVALKSKLVIMAMFVNMVGLLVPSAAYSFMM
uniref:NADH-ubiquinone oxidoreductase chain 2 n=1 Tax=Euphausia superba TaxID=6819 RepID=Q76L80_EUPSU|nr:NADH dehydrogenase subunit 2 [Euphausia superba]AOW68997.1 NADH dehydrogenase subunit 2 [Euphausia superba]BAD16760.1 NADH dehydrogenase subunit 2 [Euphausia superba]